MRLLFLLTLILVAGCAQPELSRLPAPTPPVDDSASHVNPFIGTGGHGHTFPGATVPFGMVQVSPDTRLTGWDGCSGYHYSDRHVYGFSHTHLSGTGCSDYGDILLMPGVGKALYHNGADGKPGYRSRFDKQTEVAEPGYYAVFLEDPKVRVELTATARAALHRYTFPKTAEANVILDLAHRDQTVDSIIEFVGRTEIRGMRRSRAWAKDQRVYFVIRFSKPWQSARIAIGDREIRHQNAAGRNLKAHVRFDTRRTGTVVLASVGLSSVDLAGAAKNLNAEMEGHAFIRVRDQARKAWNEQLAKIDVEGGTAAQQCIFATALYHACIAPNLFSDVDGRYRGMDGKVHKADDRDHYTVFSLWDTFRAAHPLFTLIEPERTNDFVNTMLAQFEQSRALPIWELAGNETNCMIGYHAVSVIADAWMKGIRGFDGEAALAAMTATADRDDWEGIGAYRLHGFIPAELHGESVSRTLEYAYDDWCIAVMAKALGKQDVHARFIARAQYYVNLFEPKTGFFRPKINNAFVEPFDPAEVNHHLTEANTWQYSFFVPHDVDGLAALLGGEAALAAKLDALFTAPVETTGRKQADITGLIGQYAHGNEPSHHMAYLYAFARQPWKTQARVREILDTLYSDQPDGLSGNEDCGQMSAWYVLSALGFYPVAPGSTQYVLGAPLFPRATIRLPRGKSFVIRAEGASTENRFVQSASLNGEPFERLWIDHAEITAGGELALVMGPEPNRKWAISDAARPTSRIDGPRIVPVPYLKKGPRTFRNATEVEFGTLPGATSLEAVCDAGGPLAEIESGGWRITNTATISAQALNDRAASKTVRSTFRKIDSDLKLTLLTRYAKQYTAGGDDALVDGIRGGNDFKTGAWQGYQGVDLVAVVDLGRVRKIESIQVGFVNSPRAWIWTPTTIEFSLSDDGKDYRPLITEKSDADPKGSRMIVERTKVSPGAAARYVKITARNRGTCPPDHPGAGRPAWIFADEIEIE